MSKIAAVVAIGRNREIGKDGKLLWRIPDDLKRFKQLTVGHPIILGRKTFESIVGHIAGALPERTNIVITRDPDYQQGLTERALDGVLVAYSLEEAIAAAQKEYGAEEIHIGGGAEIYSQALPQIDKLYLTLIDDAAEVGGADAFFPEYETEFTKKVFEEAREWNGLKYTWVDLER